MKEGKMRKFADTMEQTDRQTDGSKTETTLSSVDTRGSWPIWNPSQTRKAGADYDLTIQVNDIDR